MFSVHLIYSIFFYMSTNEELNRYYLNRIRERTRSYASISLDPDGIDGVWGEVGYSSELVIVHKL